MQVRVRPSKYAQNNKKRVINDIYITKDELQLRDVFILKAQTDPKSLINKLLCSKDLYRVPVV